MGEKATRLDSRRQLAELGWELRAPEPRPGRSLLPGAETAGTGKEMAADGTQQQTSGVGGWSTQ